MEITRFDGKVSSNEVLCSTVLCRGEFKPLIAWWVVSECERARQGHCTDTYFFEGPCDGG